MVRTARRALTEQQMADYERDGYLVARGMFSEEEVAEIREAFMAQAADGPVEGLSDKGRITDPK